MSQSTARTSDPEGASAPGSGRLGLLDSLAEQAVKRVAERVRASHDDPDASAQERLRAAAIGQDPRSCREVARALVADGHTVERICDVHIPEAVRRMGEEWVSDDLPFAIVTIGSARLQALLRELDLDLVSRPERAAGTAGAILLVVASGADHTLGPLVLASQLRRRGFSVRLSVGEAAEAVAEAAERTRFDAVFLSATLARSLPPLARAAAAIRAAAPPAPPVILGGAAVTWGCLPGEGRGGEGDALQEEVDLAAIDHVTCDLDEAMRLCGLGAAKKLDPRRTFSGP